MGNDIIASPSIKDIEALKEYYRIFNKKENETVDKLIAFFKDRVNNHNNCLIECTSKAAEKVMKILNVQFNDVERKPNKL